MKCKCPRNHNLLSSAQLLSNAGQSVFPGPHVLFRTAYSMVKGGFAAVLQLRSELHCAPHKRYSSCALISLSCTSAHRMAPPHSSSSSGPISYTAEYYWVPLFAPLCSVIRGKCVPQMLTQPKVISMKSKQGDICVHFRDNVLIHSRTVSFLQHSLFTVSQIF